MPVPGTPLVRQVAKANSGGYQELAGVQSVPRIARALGIDTPEQPYVPVASGLLAHAAGAADENPGTRPCSTGTPSGSPSASPPSSRSSTPS